jgi:hypothetical protein
MNEERLASNVALVERLEQGLIRWQNDVFDLYRWARQALGIKGLVLGWTPPVQRAIRRQASRSLDAFAARIADSGSGP